MRHIYLFFWRVFKLLEYQWIPFLMSHCEISYLSLSFQCEYLLGHIHCISYFLHFFQAADQINNQIFNHLDCVAWEFDSTHINYQIWMAVIWFLQLMLKNKFDFKLVLNLESKSTVHVPPVSDKYQMICAFFWVIDV